MLVPSIDIKGFVAGWTTIIIIWSFLSYGVQVPTYLIAPPGEVWQLLENRYLDFTYALWVTATQAVIGLILAIINGLAIGCVFHLYLNLAQIFLPLITITQTTPVIALAPLVTYIFGYGWWARTTATALVAIFPIILATMQGLNSTPKELEWPFKVIGKNEWFILRRIRFPYSIPQIVVAIKLASIFSVIGSVVAEFMGGNEGLGFVIMTAIYGAKSANLILSVIFSAMLGHIFLITIDLALTPLRHRYLQG